MKTAEALECGPNWRCQVALIWLVQRLSASDIFGHLDWMSQLHDKEVFFKVIHVLLDRYFQTQQKQNHSKTGVCFPSKTQPFNLMLHPSIQPLIFGGYIISQFAEVLTLILWMQSVFSIHFFQVKQLRFWRARTWPKTRCWCSSPFSTSRVSWKYKVNPPSGKLA